ncbi:MAG: hypothetical protein IID41_00580 [Planctomycetes bacterium]|nr:hypothetical protein [Planctomycetota bacterium]
MSKIHPNNIRWNYELERWEQYGAGGVWMDYPDHDEDEETDDEGETDEEGERDDVYAAEGQ